MYVIDIEASGLAEESYPIEIAWQSVSNEDDFDSFLIQPIDRWKHWDTYAEEHVHHISRNSLFEQGISAQSACERLNERLKNKVVYSDAVNFDERWILKLFNDLGIKPSFSIKSIFSLDPDFQEAAYSEELCLQPVKHRALDDARQIARILKLYL